MRLFKATAILSLVLISGCMDYDVSAPVLIQTKKTEAPYSAKILAKTKNGYRVEVYSTGEEIEVSSGQVIRQIDSAAEEMLAVAKWKADNKPFYGTEGVSKAEKASTAKSLLFFCGLLPVTLFALCFLSDGFVVVTIPYFIGGCLVYGMFPFFSILILFLLASLVIVLILSACLGGFINWGNDGYPLGIAAYAILLAMFFLS